MQIVEIFAMDQQVEHVVALTTHLQTRFHPINRCRLEEFRRFEGPEQVPLLLRFRVTMFQRIQHEIFQQFLVADSYFDWLAWGTVFLVPGFY